MAPVATSSQAAAKAPHYSTQDIIDLESEYSA